MGEGEGGGGSGVFWKRNSERHRNRELIERNVLYWLRRMYSTTGIASVSFLFVTVCLLQTVTIVAQREGRQPSVYQKIRFALFIAYNTPLSRAHCTTGGADHALQPDRPILAPYTRLRNLNGKRMQILSLRPLLDQKTRF